MDLLREKAVTVSTPDGHQCLLMMRVAYVKEPLMGVARISDAGRQVVFTEPALYAVVDPESCIAAAARLF